MNTKLNKLLIPLSIIISFSLSGCFSVDSNSNTSNSSTNNDQSSTQLKVYNNNKFSFSFPSDWDLIQPKDFTSEIPNETQVVIRNNLKNDTFTANANVVRNDLQINQSTLDYSKEILNRQKTGLLDYKELKRDLVKISIGGIDQETYYVEFEARLNATEPVTKFLQTFAVKDKAGYIIMGALSLQDQLSVVNKVSAIVKSFKVS